MYGSTRLSRVIGLGAVAAILSFAGCLEDEPDDIVDPDLVLRVEMKKYPDLDDLPKTYLSRWKNQTLKGLYPGATIDVKTYSKGDFSGSKYFWEYSEEGLRNLKTADCASDLSILMAWCYTPFDEPEIEPRTYTFPYPDRHVAFGLTPCYENVMLENTDCHMIDAQFPISVIFYGTALALFRDLSIEWEYKDCIQVYMDDILTREVCHEMTHQLSVPDNPDTTCDDPTKCDCVMDPRVFTYLLDNLSTDPEERCTQLAERWKNMMNTGIRDRHQIQACTTAELLQIQAIVPCGEAMVQFNQQ